MKKNALEIYEKIVKSPIGGTTGTRHKNGINYSQTIEDMLRQQGYKIGDDYETVYDWRTHQNYIKKLAKIAPYKPPVHDIKPGDIFYNVWGWEQTNIDFYQVIATTAKTISLRRIKGYSKDYNDQFMSGSKMPVKNNFANDEIIRKTPYLSGDEWRVHFEFGSGGKWDGKPMSFSCYA